MSKVLAKSKAKGVTCKRRGNISYDIFFYHLSSPLNQIIIVVVTFRAFLCRSPVPHSLVEGKAENCTMKNKNLKKLA